MHSSLPSLRSSSHCYKLPEIPSLKALFACQYAPVSLLSARKEDSTARLLLDDAVVRDGLANHEKGRSGATILGGQTAASQCSADKAIEGLLQTVRAFASQ
jgi:hypothetical protein